MTICGGCGLTGVRENNWNPPEHKCPRWNTEYNALQRVANTAEAMLENGAITEYHLRLVLKNLRKVEEKCKQINYEKAIADYTCTVCGKLDPTSPGKCQRCQPVTPPTEQ